MDGADFRLLSSIMSYAFGIWAQGPRQVTGSPSAAVIVTPVFLLAQASLGY